ncbi:MAG: EFR1 family ferrodoxin [Planctomycetota bacterium]
MHAAIVYHSSTGNTRHCVEVVKAEIEKAGHACDIFDTRQAEGVDLKAFDMLGVASAVYGFRPAYAALKFLRDMPPVEDMPAFVLACCSLIPANSLNRMARMLRGKGAQVLGGIEVRGEEAWTAIRFPGLIIGKGRPNAQDDETVRAFTRDMIEAHGQAISGKAVPRSRFRRFSPWGLIGSLTCRPVMRYAMLGKKLNEDKCTKCGLCAEKCPTNSIALAPYPTFGGGCMGCFACVNLCPEEAIRTPWTWGRVRYKGYGNVE